MLAVLSLLVLRVTDPYCARPFKVWTIVPIVFCLLSAGLLILSIWQAPLESILALLFLFVGVPFYYTGFGFLDNRTSRLKA